MRALAFLASGVGEPANDNRERLSRAFVDAGWEVASLTWESLSVMERGVVASTREGHTTPLDVFDLVWLLGFGGRETFLDRMQMLRTVPQQRFVNSVDALVFQHGKFGLAEFQPETYASADPDVLLRRVARGGEWVAKPVAGSFGRDVHRLCAERPDARDVLLRLTANGGYCVLQRYVPEAREREKRVIVAGDTVIGAYAKTGNLRAGATPRTALLSAAEEGLVGRVIARLNAQGVRFAGIDLAWPYLFEANVANPGGLATLEALTGVDPTPRVVEALLSAQGTSDKSGLPEPTETLRPRE